MMTRWLVAGLFATIPPLTGDQSQRLGGAVDGSDHHDEAFLALVENTRTWSPGLGDASIRLNPDVAEMLKNPGPYRGELCRVTGALQQATRLSPPFEEVVEWFVRQADQRVAIVYVVGAAEAGNFRVWDAVEIDARLYKRMEFTARDGIKRDYPAFVGAFPRAHGAAATTPALSPASIVAGLVAIMAVAFIGLMMWARRSGGGRHELLRIQKHRPLPASGGAVDDREALPDDPAGALSELKRRADLE